MTKASPQKGQYFERADFYDIDYQCETDHTFLSQLITPEVSRILEVPCAVGRNTFMLARSGCQVTSVDLEQGMIDHLKDRLSAKGVTNVTPMVGDMRNLNLGKKFQLIIVAQEAFQLLTSEEDARLALLDLRKHLAPNGKIVVDLATYRPGLDEDSHLHPDYFHPDINDGQLVEDWTRKSRKGASITRTRTQSQPSKETIKINFHYKIMPEGGATQVLEAEVEMKRYSYDQFVTLAKLCNLVVKDVYRNYDKEPYKNEAIRMIFILETE